MVRFERFLKNNLRALGIGLAVYFAFTENVLADCWDDCQHPSGAATISCLECAFANIVEAILTFAGIGLLVMLIVGGFSYLTAGADPKAVEKASKTLTSAFLGLLLVIGAWIILRAIEMITGVNVTIFKVGS